MVGVIFTNSSTRPQSQNMCWIAITAAIIGAKTSAEGREKKPFAKHEGQQNKHHDGRHNANCHENTTKKEHFWEVDLDFCGHVFEAKHTQSEQVVNLTTVNDIIRA